jgi:hypothetical protein
MTSDEESSASSFSTFLEMKTFETGCWKRGMLAFHLMELFRLKLRDLFEVIILITLTSGQIFVPCRFLGYRVLNDDSLLSFLVNLLKLLLTYFLIQRDLNIRY